MKVEACAPVHQIESFHSSILNPTVERNAGTEDLRSGSWANSWAWKTRRRNAGGRRGREGYQVFGRKQGHGGLGGYELEGSAGADRWQWPLISMMPDSLHEGLAPGSTTGCTVPAAWCFLPGAVRRWWHAQLHSGRREGRFKHTHFSPTYLIHQATWSGQHAKGQRGRLRRGKRDEDGGG